MSKEDVDATYQLNLNYRTTIPMEAQLPPTPLTPSIITFTDLLDDTMAQVNAPQCPDESDALYNQLRNAALQYAQQRAVQPELHIKTETVDNNIDLFTIHSQARGTNEPHPYMRTTPFHAPMNDNLQTHIVFQRLCNEDLASCGKSLYNDQGIIFRNHKPVDLMREQYLQSTGQALAPKESNGDDDGDDDGDHQGLHHPGEKPHGNGHGGPPGNPGGGRQRATRWRQRSVQR
jgi:hypothetical protein